jgi:hypothetical protein
MPHSLDALERSSKTCQDMRKKVTSEKWIPDEGNDDKNTTSKFARKPTRAGALPPNPRTLMLYMVVMDRLMISHTQSFVCGRLELVVSLSGLRLLIV